MVVWSQFGQRDGCYGWWSHLIMIFTGAWKWNSSILALVINCIYWSRHFLDQSWAWACLFVDCCWITTAGRSMPQHAWVIISIAKYWQLNRRINFETWFDPNLIIATKYGLTISMWSLWSEAQSFNTFQYTNGNFLFFYGKADWSLWCIKCALLISEIKEWGNSKRLSR